jgi:LDH2 family malate/lactate/ureidoglycolate dehydrogenase
MGNNALCCIMPAEDPRFPFIVDLATGTVACGKIRVAAARGERIPPGWLVDKNGVETTDPADLDAGGAVPVFGDYKGLAISVMVEILAGILGGSTVSPLVSRQRHVPDQAMGCSQLVIGIRMSDEVSSGRGAYLLSRLRRAVDASYDSTPPAIRFPEQQERMIVEQSTCEGVQVSRSTMDTIRADACD